LPGPFPDLKEFELDFANETLGFQQACDAFYLKK